MTKNCAACDYGPARDASTVWCKRFPPRVTPPRPTDTDAEAKFPICANTSVCGEFKDGLLSWP